MILYSIHLFIVPHLFSKHPASCQAQTQELEPSLAHWVLPAALLGTLTYIHYAARETEPQGIQVVDCGATWPATLHPVHPLEKPVPLFVSLRGPGWEAQRRSQFARDPSQSPSCPLNIHPQTLPRNTGPELSVAVVCGHVCAHSYMTQDFCDVWKWTSGFDCVSWGWSFGGGRGWRSGPGGEHWQNKRNNEMMAVGVAMWGPGDLTLRVTHLDCCEDQITYVLCFQIFLPPFAKNRKCFWVSKKWSWTCIPPALPLSLHALLKSKLPKTEVRGHTASLTHCLAYTCQWLPTHDNKDRLLPSLPTEWILFLLLLWQININLAAWNNSHLLCTQSGRSEALCGSSWAKTRVRFLGLGDKNIGGGGSHYSAYRSVYE